jgi:helix-turn-helix, Psq domain
MAEPAKETRSSAAAAAQAAYDRLSPLDKAVMTYQRGQSGEGKRLSLRKVAEQFGVPTATLGKHVAAADAGSQIKAGQPGRPNSIPDAVVEGCVKLAHELSDRWQVLTVEASWCVLLQYRRNELAMKNMNPMSAVVTNRDANKLHNALKKQLKMIEKNNQQTKRRLQAAFQVRNALSFFAVSTAVLFDDPLLLQRPIPSSHMFSGEAEQ